MKRLSLSDNPICDVPAVLRRKWRNLVQGPLKWVLVGIAAVLTALVALVPTVKDEGGKQYKKPPGPRQYPPRPYGPA